MVVVVVLQNTTNEPAALVVPKPNGPTFVVAEYDVGYNQNSIEKSPVAGAAAIVPVTASEVAIAERLPPTAETPYAVVGANGLNGVVIGPCAAETNQSRDDIVAFEGLLSTCLFALQVNSTVLLALDIDAIFVPADCVVDKGLVGTVKLPV